MRCDAMLYDMGEPVMGSIAGRPDTSGWIFELNYLPVHNVKIGARYTLYREFNGGRADCDGFGRNARDNSAVYLYAWLLF